MQPPETGIDWFRTGVIPPAGVYKNFWADPFTLFFIEVVAIQFAELKRLQDFRSARWEGGAYARMHDCMQTQPCFCTYSSYCMCDRTHGGLAAAPLTAWDAHQCTHLLQTPSPSLPKTHTGTLGPRASSTS